MNQLDIVGKHLEPILYARIELITESPTGLKSEFGEFRNDTVTLRTAAQTPVWIINYG